MTSRALSADEILSELRALEREEEQIQARARDISKRRQELLGLRPSGRRQPSIKAYKQMAQDIINTL